MSSSPTKAFGSLLDPRPRRFRRGCAKSPVFDDAAFRNSFERCRCSPPIEDSCLAHNVRSDTMSILGLFLCVYTQFFSISLRSSSLYAAGMLSRKWLIFAPLLRTHSDSVFGNSPGLSQGIRASRVPAFSARSQSRRASKPRRCDSITPARESIGSLGPMFRLEVTGSQARVHGNPDARRVTRPAANSRTAG
jgi:hypothetical protein